jgi:hypothetical protein
MTHTVMYVLIAVDHADAGLAYEYNYGYLAVPSHTSVAAYGTTTSAAIAVSRGADYVAGGLNTLLHHKPSRGIRHCKTIVSERPCYTSLCYLQV